MIISNPLFLFVFFPISFFIYWVMRDEYRNAWLLFCSLLFYAWGGIGYLLLILFSVLINYLLSHWLLHKNKIALVLSICFNLGILVFFKYTKFILENILAFVPGYSIDHIPVVTNIVLPIGISFFTFQILGYTIDLYNRKIEKPLTYGNLLLFIVMYPRLMAGPIIRYSDVRMQIHQRTVAYRNIYEGLKRFIYGLSKKVLLADVLGVLVETLFSSGGGTLVSWIGMTAYSLQLYFDFAGYTDMAIGMGKMLGFSFPENFDDPYHSKSIKEFWRRWHISLSSWFRDYLYIPLGGNRSANWKTYRNLAIVFLATGLWHGASWNFVVWGIWHGFFVIIERLGFCKILAKIPSFFQRLYALLVVGIGWLMFRTESIENNWQSIKALFGYKSSDFGQVLTYFEPKILLCFVCSIFICIVGSKRKIKNEIFSDFLTIVLFIVVLLQISTNNFSPFLYARF